MSRGRRAATLALVVLAAGCAPKRVLPELPTPESLPPGSPLRSRSLSAPDAWLRHYLMTGEHARAAEAVRPGAALAPRDALLRALQEGVVLRAAGRYEESNRALEWAEREAELRFTRSVSRAAATLLVNDGVMGYTPPASELLMVPYYRMLNHLALGDREGALVEARKANALLARLPRQEADRCREDGALRYLAGLVQEQGGELNDALVTLRWADRSFAGCADPSPELTASVAADLHRVARAAGVDEVADSVAARYPEAAAGRAGGAGGDLLLLVEQGFVAHRAEQALHVPIFPDDLDGLESGDEKRIESIAGRLTDRLLRDAWERERWGRARSDAPIFQWASALGGAHVLRLAWPAMRLEAARPVATRVRIGDSILVVRPASDLSAVMSDELADRRAAILTRLVARGLLKYLVSREMEHQTEKKSGELAGFVVGRLANLAANHLEQADLRSWSLLPDRISIVRSRLPAGAHRVWIETLGRDGRVIATRDLGEVTIRPGELTVLSERIWGEEQGELPVPRVPPEWLAADSAAAPPSAALAPPDTAAAIP